VVPPPHKQPKEVAKPLLKAFQVVAYFQNGLEEIIDLLHPNHFVPLYFYNFLFEDKLMYNFIRTVRTFVGRDFFYFLFFTMAYCMDL
jgi:hypothetical protein